MLILLGIVLLAIYLIKYNLPVFIVSVWTASLFIFSDVLELSRGTKFVTTYPMIILGHVVIFLIFNKRDVTGSGILEDFEPSAIPVMRRAGMSVG